MSIYKRFFGPLYACSDIIIMQIRLDAWYNMKGFAPIEAVPASRSSIVAWASGPHTRRTEYRSPLNLIVISCSAPRHRRDSGGGEKERKKKRRNAKRIARFNYSGAIIVAGAISAAGKFGD